MEAKRDDLDYEIDGVVVKVIRLFAGTVCATGKAPRWAVAYKYAARQATTKVNEL
jgi:DNA ligase (NAD+)